MKEWNVNMKYSEAKSAILTEINTALEQIDEKQLESYVIIGGIRKKIMPFGNRDSLCWRYYRASNQ